MSTSVTYRPDVPLSEQTRLLSFGENPGSAWSRRHERVNREYEQRIQFVDATPPTPRVPPVITGVAVGAEDADDDEVTLAWDPVSNAVEYRVFQSTDPDNFPEEFETVAASELNAEGRLEYTADGLAEDETYLFRFTACGVGNRCSAPSPSVTLFEEAEITEDTFGAESVTDGSVVLTWTAPAATTFTVERKPSSPSTVTFAEIATITESEYTDTDVEPNTEYDYMLTAEYFRGAVPATATLIDTVTTTNATPAGPPTVTMVSSTTPTSATVALTFPRVPNADEYEVFLSTGLGEFESIATFPVPNSGPVQYTATGLSEGTAYSFRFAACATGGIRCSAPSPDVSVITPFSDVPAITSFEAVAITQNSASLTWAAERGTTYTVERKLGSELPSAFTDVATDISGTAYTDTGLNSNTDYDYRLTASNDQGESPMMVISVPTRSAPNVSPAGLPVITGTTTVGETLTADTSGITDGNGLAGVSFTYQWQQGDRGDATVTESEWEDISGATSLTYDLARDSYQRRVRVVVSFTDEDDYDETLNSLATAAISPEANAPATGLVISGDVSVGSTLTAQGITDGNELTRADFTYQWRQETSDGSNSYENIPLLANAQTYIVAAQVGRRIQVVVTFTDDQGYSETLTATTTGPVISNSVASIAITGTARVGVTLTATVTDADLTTTSPNSFTYLWQQGAAGGSDGSYETITGETGTSLVLTSTHAGRRIRVMVSFTDDRGNAESPVSVPTAVVNTPVSGVPAISGRNRVGSPLTTSAGGISDEDVDLSTANLTFEWQKLSSSNELGWVDIVTGDIEEPSLVGTTITPTNLLALHSIRVRVSFTDGLGVREETEYSLQTNVIVLVLDSNLLAWTPAEGETLTLPTLSAGNTAGFEVTLTNTISNTDLRGISIFRELRNIAGNTEWQSDTGRQLVQFIGRNRATIRQFFNNSPGREYRVCYEVSGGDNVCSGVLLIPAVNSPATGTLTVGGTVMVGETLTWGLNFINELNGVDGLTYTYSWEQGDVDGSDSGYQTIPGTEDIRMVRPNGAQGFFTLTNDQRRRRIRAVLEFTDNGGHQERLVSDPTVVVPNIQTPATGAPAVSGFANHLDFTDGASINRSQTLTAILGTLEDANGLDFSDDTKVTFQWQFSRGNSIPADDSDWLDISGAAATSRAYTVPPNAFANRHFRVVVSFTDNEGNIENSGGAGFKSPAAAKLVNFGPPSSVSCIDTDGRSASNSLVCDANLTFNIENSGQHDGTLHVFVAGRQSGNRVGATTAVPIRAGTSQTVTHTFSAFAGSGTTTNRYFLIVSTSSSGTNIANRVAQSAFSVTLIDAFATSPATGAPAVSGLANRGADSSSLPPSTCCTLTATVGDLQDSNGLDFDSIPNANFRWERSSTGTGGWTDTGMTGRTFRTQNNNDHIRVVLTSFMDDRSNLENNGGDGFASASAAKLSWENFQATPISSDMFTITVDVVNTGGHRGTGYFFVTAPSGGRRIENRRVQVDANSRSTEELAISRAVAGRWFIRLHTIPSIGVSNRILSMDFRP